MFSVYAFHLLPPPPPTHGPYQGPLSCFGYHLISVWKRECSLGGKRRKSFERFTLFPSSSTSQDNGGVFERFTLFPSSSTSHDIGGQFFLFSSKFLIFMGGTFSFFLHRPRFMVNSNSWRTVVMSCTRTTNQRQKCLHQLQAKFCWLHVCNYVGTAQRYFQQLNLLSCDFLVFFSFNKRENSSRTFPSIGRRERKLIMNRHYVHRRVATVKEEIFVGGFFVILRPKPFVWNLINSERWKKLKQEETIEGLQAKVKKILYEK